MTNDGRFFLNLGCLIGLLSAFLLHLVIDDSTHNHSEGNMDTHASEEIDAGFVAEAEHSGGVCDPVSCPYCLDPEPDVEDDFEGY